MYWPGGRSAEKLPLLSLDTVVTGVPADDDLVAGAVEI
jgi:hypothetical protein